MNRPLLAVLLTAAVAGPAAANWDRNVHDTLRQAELASPGCMDAWGGEGGVPWHAGCEFAVPFSGVIVTIRRTDRSDARRYNVEFRDGWNVAVFGRDRTFLGDQGPAAGGRAEPAVIEAAIARWSAHFAEQRAKKLGADAAARL